MIPLAVVLLALVNVQRIHYHEQALHPAPSIASCDESRPLQCVRRKGLRSDRAGVITAWGMRSPSEAVRAWLHSPPHRAIMLDPAYQLAGAFMRGTFARVVLVSSPKARDWAPPSHRPLHTRTNTSMHQNPRDDSLDAARDNPRAVPLGMLGMGSRSPSGPTLHDIAPNADRHKGETTTGDKLIRGAEGQIAENALLTIRPACAKG